MDASTLTAKRLTDLEIKASFAEDLLDELNRVVVRQQQQIDLLTREVLQLRQQAPESGTGGASTGNTTSRARDELPPHY